MIINREGTLNFGLNLRPRVQSDILTNLSFA